MLRASFPLIAFLLWCSLSGVAQNRISGKVVDAQTGEPVAFASVFFANTTFGASTDAAGYYSFANFPSGKYDLSITFVGYQPFQRAIEFTQNQSTQVDAALQQQSVLLSEIFIKPDTLNWKRNYEEFKRHFLGRSKFADESVIQNPRDIHLYFDPQSTVLVAHAKKPIVIENALTGYRIYYHLYQFEYNARARYFNILGLPQFELLTPKSATQKKRWERNRKEIYEGSLMHFTRSWLTQQWQQEGFTVSRMYRINNKERPSDEFLSKKINELRNKMLAEGKPIVISLDKKKYEQDSLSYHMNLRAKPKEIDSVANEVLIGNEFTEASVPEMKNFIGLLQIRYDKKEDPRYAASVGRPSQIGRYQQSIIHIKSPLKLYENGYYEEVSSIFLEQYWSWTEKIATMLPLDYQPIE
jgi:CarboxypepD_reg-like domain